MSLRHEHEAIFGFVACATPIADGETDLCAHISDLDLLNLFHKSRIISNNSARPKFNRVYMVLSIFDNDAARADFDNETLVQPSK